MKLNPENPLLLAAITLAGFAFSAPAAFALTWDITDNGATIEAGNGAWDLSATNWNGTPNVAWIQTDTVNATQAAVFAGADAAVDSYVVTLASQMAATSLTFNNTGYKLTGSMCWAAPASGGATIITVAANKTATIDSALTSRTGNEQTVVINSGSTLNLGGNNTGFRVMFGGTSAVNGAGTLNITGGTSALNNPRLNTATMNQTGGSVSLAGSSTAGNWIGYDAKKNVNYTISGGSLNVNGTSGAYLAIGRTMAANTATLTVQTGSTVNIGTTGSGQLNINGDGSAATAKLDVQGGNLTVGTSNAANLLIFFPSAANAGKTALMTQSGGTVSANGIQFGGTAGTYDATSSATLKLTGGNLYVGTLGIAKGSGAATLPVTIQLQGGTLGASAAWTSALDMKLTDATIRAQNSASTAYGITLSGNLSDDTAVNGTLTKTGTGTLTLSGTNTYTGTTTGIAGTLTATKVASLAGYNSPGKVIFNGGTIGAQVEVGVSGGWTTGEVDTLLTNATTTSGALGIDTTNGDLAQWTAFTTTNFGSTLGLTKLGANTLTLDLANSYAGTTAVSAGTLKLANTAALGSSALVQIGGNTLHLATDTAFSSSAVIQAGSGTTATVISDRATAGAGLTHVFGNMIGNSGTINFTAGANVTSGTAAIQVAALSLPSGSGSTVILNPTTANLIIASASGGNTGTGTLTLGGTSAGNSISGVISNGSRTTQNLNKSNSSIWILSGANTYTGTTTITGGTLLLGADNVFPDASPVSIGTATLDVATFDDTLGTLDATGSAVINLGSGANLAFADSSAVDWTGGTLNITGTLGATSLRFGTTSGGLTTAQLALISVNGSGLGTYTLDASGYLVAGGFSSWITGTFTAGATVPSGQQGPNADFDNDGISNLVEYAIAGQDPTVGKSTIGTFSDGTLSYTKRTGTNGLTYAIQDSTDLGVADAWTAVTGTPPTYVNDVTTISYKLTPGTPVRNFLRLQVLSN